MALFQRMGPAICGTRAQYQAGCRCAPCRRAEAAYRQRLRGQHVRGQIPLGARVPAAGLWKRVKSLQVEAFTKAEIARRLGLKRPILEWHPVTVTRKTEQRLEQFYQQVMAEGPELTELSEHG